MGAGPHPITKQLWVTGGEGRDADFIFCIPQQCAEFCMSCKMLWVLTDAVRKVRWGNSTREDFLQRVPSFCEVLRGGSPEEVSLLSHSSEAEPPGPWIRSHPPSAHTIHQTHTLAGSRGFAHCNFIRQALYTWEGFSKMTLGREWAAWTSSLPVLIHVCLEVDDLIGTIAASHLKPLGLRG